MSLQQILGRFATTAAALVLIAALSAVRGASRSGTFKRDLRASQLYLIGFLLVELLRKLIPDSWSRVDKYATLIGLIFFSFGAIRGIAGTWFHLHRTRTGIDTPKILRDLVDAALFLLALIFILQATLQVNVSALLASSAVISLVLGLALQETLGNLFAGLSLQAERPFSEGDWVRIGPHTGKVLEIGWRATRIQSGTGEVLTVPNNAVAKEAIYNLSRGKPTLRKVSVGIGYEVAPNAFKELVLELLRANPGVLSQPAPVVRTADFGAATITYDLFFWVARFEDGAPLEDEIRSQLWYRLRRSGIDIPFPTTHVQVSQPQQRLAEVVPIDVPALLARVDFLSGVPEPLRAKLAARAAIVRFGRGEVIIRQGDAEPGAFYIVAEGEVSVRVRTEISEEREIARLGPSEFFGEMAVLTGEPRSASVVAVTDSALVAIDRAGFAELFSSDPAAARALAEVLAHRREGLNKAIAAARAQQPAPPPEPSQLLEKLRQIFRHLT